MNFLSLFSGIEAASVAFVPLGWEPMVFSEIDRAASAVLSHHYPNVPNVGDITKHDWMRYNGKCDLVIGGSPCQSFSLAGLRGSMDDARGNLAFAYCKAIHAIDPVWGIYENVPGILSTKDNAFGCILAGLVGANEPIIPRTCSGRWTSAGMVCGPRRSAAWRILDAQYVALAGGSAVPQRRNRVFVVSRNYGDLGGLETPSFQRNQSRVFGLLGEILLEPEGMQRHSAPSRKAGKGIAGTLASRTRGGGGLGTDFDLSGGLQVFGGSADERSVGASLNAHGQRFDFDSENLIAHTLRADGFDGSEDGTGRGTPLVSFNWQSGGDVRLHPMEDMANSIQRGQCQAVFIPIQEVGKRTGKSTSDTQHGSCIGKNGDPMFTLQSAAQHGIAEIAFSSKQDASDIGDTTPPLRAMGHDVSHANGGGQIAVHGGTKIRRITEIEAERLMGFPENYTLVPYRGGMMKSGPRYKMLGNSIVTNCLAWIGSRIDRVHKRMHP